MFNDLSTDLDVFWHPFRMHLVLAIIPVVFAPLRPPATFWHPCGMYRRAHLDFGSPTQLPSMRPMSRYTIASSFIHFFALTFAASNSGFAFSAQSLFGNFAMSDS